MPLTTTAQVVILGNLPDEGNEERLVEYMAAAERKMRSYLSDELYDELEADTEDDPNGDKAKLAQAEAFLALSEMMPVLNLRINPNDGGIVQSVGFGESKNTLLSFDDVKKIAAMFLDKAMAILETYIEPEDEDDLEEIGGNESFGYFAV